ncbi:hypothetical protein PPACK8108_LOCUS2771 [Phakopsora pachyrhizi]|uniref:Uncharacterized protein n=1 Tax=Phakopsora pachyrhizi TaxID=170000 RepID=A0AAV0AJS7_PHAPC|nr:hypothetical protein PPACK8108_LOCUS2771 [Phakopsora pachyrhizi]
MVEKRETRIVMTLGKDNHQFYREEVRPYRDENLFEVEFRNDLMDSPPAVDWKVMMVVVAVTVDDRTNDWVRVRVKLMKAIAMVVIDQY